MAGFFDGAGSGLIGAAGGLLGSIFGGFSQARQNEKIMQHQRQLMYAQFDHDKDMAELNSAYAKEFRELDFGNWLRTFDIQNKYNSPEAQKQRMLEAGINPFLGDSDIGTGTSSSSPTYGGSPSGSASGVPSAPMLEAPNYLGGLDVAFKNIASTISQLGVNDANVGKTNSETSLNWQQYQFNNQFNPKQLKLADSQLALNEATTQQIEETKALVAAQRVGQDLTNEQLKILNKYYDAQQQADLLFNFARGLYQLQSIKESQARVGNISADTKKKFAEIKRIGTQMLVDRSIARLNNSQANLNDMEHLKLTECFESIIKDIEYQALLSEITYDSFDMDMKDREYNTYIPGHINKYYSPGSINGEFNHGFVRKHMHYLGRGLDDLNPFKLRIGSASNRSR